MIQADEHRQYLDELIAEYESKAATAAEDAARALKFFPRHDEGKFQACRRLVEKFTLTADSYRAVRDAVDRVEAGAHAAEAKKQADHRTFLERLRADDIPGDELKDLARETLHSIMRSVDPNQHYVVQGNVLTGYDAIKYCGWVRSGELGAEQELVLRSAVASKKLQAHETYSIEVFLDAHDEMLKPAPKTKGKKSAA